MESERDGEGATGTLGKAIAILETVALAERPMRFIRRQGIAFDREEHEPGIRCVAAPVFDARRSLVAGVSVTGPAYRVGLEQLDGWGPLVRDTARAIMAELAARLGPQR